MLTPKAFSKFSKKKRTITFSYFQISHCWDFLFKKKLSKFFITVCDTFNQFLAAIWGLCSELRRDIIVFNNLATETGKIKRSSIFSFDCIIWYFGQLAWKDLWSQATHILISFNFHLHLIFSRLGNPSTMNVIL